MLRMLPQEEAAFCFSLSYLLGLPPAFEDEDVSVDVFHTDPARQAERRVRPNPVHHRTQLRQERDHTEPGTHNAY